MSALARVCALLLMTAAVTSQPVTDTTTTTERPFKPSLQLATSPETEGVPKEAKDSHNKNARSFSVLGPVLSSIVGHPPPHRPYPLPRPVHSLAPHLNYHPSSGTPAVGDEGKPPVQVALDSTQHQAFLTPYQHAKTNIPPSLLAMAVANSPYFNSGGSPQSLVGPQSHLGRYVPHPAMYLGMPGFAPYLPPNPLVSGQGMFGPGTTGQSIPVIILRVGEHHQMLGMNLFMIQPQYSPSPMMQPQNYPIPLPLPLAQLQNTNPHQLKLDDNTANINVHAGLPPPQYKTPSLPTPPAERLKTEAIMSPLHPYAYEDYMEKAK